MSMHHQEHISRSSDAAASAERAGTTDPRAQSVHPQMGDRWSEGEKLRPTARSERSVGGLLMLVVLLCAVCIAGSLSGVILSWLSWLIVIVLVIAGLGALASNWRVVTMALPVRTFPIAEHARLIITNGAGRVAIHRGEEGMISVRAIKKASGFGIDPAKMQIDYDQRGDTLNIYTQVSWNILQFGLRGIDFDITVPAACDIQLENGSGSIFAQGTAGDLSLRTGSGGIAAYDLQGQIVIKTASGGIRLGGLQGSMLVTTGSGGVKGAGLQGQLELTTGSGGVSLQQSLLASTSRISTGSGGIHFEGALDPCSTTDIKTGSGGITLRLPASSAFVLQARTGSGGVHNEFGHNEVGGEPRAVLRLRTGSGGIHIVNSGREGGDLARTPWADA